jgi:hypothetical protein
MYIRVHTGFCMDHNFLKQSRLAAEIMYAHKVSLYCIHHIINLHAVTTVG